MVTPDLIVRTHRRSLCLTITKDGNLVVHAPTRMNMNDILKYISEKEKWIVSKQQEIERKLSINKVILDYNQILFLGTKYNIQRVNGLKKIELSQNALMVPDSDNVLFKIKKWYIAQATKILKERLEYFANIMQIDYASVSICNSKTRWGSCDNYHNIKLNFRLVMLPHRAIDFVLIHELAHILEFNHSKDFYKIIQTIMPTYKVQQKVLKDYDYVLKLFR
ncbi:MAG: M48 family metallopeptidase [Firmicutes bacterium]|nr:M48 family metallopeptidase [Bacillota bacterium]MDY5676992.1 SprT family zinc-dependent metalloprotease [Eubacteriales bacterium]